MYEFVVILNTFIGSSIQRKRRLLWKLASPVWHQGTKRNPRIVCRRVLDFYICEFTDRSVRKKGKERWEIESLSDTRTLREVLVVQSNKPFPASCLWRRPHFFRAKLWTRGNAANPAFGLHKNMQKMSERFIFVELEVVIFIMKQKLILLLAYISNI